MIRRYTAIAILLASVCIMCGILAFGREWRLEVCTLCGKQRDVTRRWVVGTNLYWAAGSVERDSRLSLAVAKERIVSAHEHSWLATSISVWPRNSDFVCRGVPVERNVESDKVAPFIVALYRYEGSEASLGWLESALSPESASAFSFALEYCQFSTAHTGSRDVFLKWWSRNGATMESVMRIRAHAPS